MEIVVKKSEESFTAFCSTNEFKKLVKEAVNDEMFYSRIIQQLSIGNLVQQELNSKLPSLQETLKAKTKVLVGALTTEKFREYSQNQIPSCVAKEISSQIDKFLSNNIQVLQMVDFHTNQLNSKLTQTATETLVKLVNEPQYQIVTSTHLSAMDQKCELKIFEIQTACNQQLTNNYSKFTDQLKELKQTNDKELSQLKGGLKELKDLDANFSNYRMKSTQRLNVLNDRIIMLEQQSTNVLKWLIGLSCTALAGAFYLIKK